MQLKVLEDEKTEAFYSPIVWNVIPEVRKEIPAVVTKGVYQVHVRMHIRCSAGNI